MIDSRKVVTQSFSHEAMATSISVIIAHEDRDYAAKAAKAAFIEIDRIESRLSRFTEGSDIWCLNHTSPNTVVPVSIETWECLKLATDIAILTNGAFDFTIGILADAWKASTTPPPEFIEKLLDSTGNKSVNISSNDYTVSRTNELVSIDLGAIGKGFAIDKAAELLEDWDITHAMFNCGGSSILALDPPPNADGWEVSCGNSNFMITQGAVSASGFAEQPNHIIDPRTGRPPKIRQRTWAMAPTAAISDAISTATTIMNAEQIDIFRSKYPEIKILTE